MLRESNKRVVRVPSSAITRVRVATAVTAVIAAGAIAWGVLLGTAPLVLSGSAFLIALVGLAVIIEVAVFQPLRYTVGEVGNLNRGEIDLTHRFGVGGNRESFQIHRGVNVFVARLHELLKQLKDISERTGTASDSVATNAEELSATMREMATSMESMAQNGETLEEEITEAADTLETVRSRMGTVRDALNTQESSNARAAERIEAFASDVTQTRDEAQNRAEEAKRLEKTAADSSATVREAMESFNAITNAIGDIEHVVQVISGVAAQTNMLAMNAAIEAAHAGEKGAGFAVVAAEIRSLAESASANAKTIRGTINDIVRRAGKASNLVASTEEAFGTLERGVGTITGSMGDIAARMQTMESAAAEVEKAIAETRGSGAESSRVGGQAQEQAAQVADRIGSVAGLSRQNSGALAEMNQGMQEVNQALQSLAQSGSDNARVVKDLEQSTERFVTYDTSSFTATDGKPLISWIDHRKEVPQRPDNPESFPKQDRRHWYDYEYAGWNRKLVALPESLALGPEGTQVAVVIHGSQDVDYIAPYERGLRTVASAFGVSLEISYCDWDDDAQRRIVPQVVERRPDGIILLPTSADHSLELAQLIHGAGIPLIMSNTNPETDGFNYILTWTGPDDWGQTRQVARHFGELIGDGGYAILQHVPGISAHYARCWGVITELADTKPGAQCLAVAYPGFDPEKAKAQVVEWIRAYGSSLKGIYCADDASYGLGVRNALAQEGRNDIVVSAAGASSVGLQLVKEGVISGMSYQSAEGDGALAMKAMVDWFSGLDLAPLTYMPYELITRDNVEDFLPAQW